MKLCKVLCSFFTLVIIVTAGNDAGGDHHAVIDMVEGHQQGGDHEGAIEVYEEHHKERHLQISSAFCEYVTSTLVGGLFSCGCNTDIFKGMFDFQCVTSPICSPGGFVCGVIGVDLDFQLPNFIPSVDFCIFNATIGPYINVLNQPICLVPILFPSTKQKSCRNFFRCIFSGKAASMTKPTAVMKECNLYVGYNKCSTCNVCDDEESVTFDCSNIVAGLKTSTCTNFNIPTGFGSMATATLPDIVLD